MKLFQVTNLVFLTIIVTAQFTVGYGIGIDKEHEEENGEVLEESE